MAKRRRRRTRVSLGEPTKKDFIAFSKILCRNGASHGLVQDMASYFGSQNPRFDRNRFIDAASKC